ncbi:GNAT family N-acetyltransferase [Peribacillus loiseleuriae]|uniref:GNAT family N-acetyltransferase n=1 Tax=Peribacillus loiseleuriae TaxID=1679170 RepID=UPI003D062266
MKIEGVLKEVPTLETGRLLLRKIKLNDLDDIFEFSSDPEVAHHMTWEVNRSKEWIYSTSPFLNIRLSS